MLEYNLWGFCFSPDKVMQRMILRWKTDMMGLMLAFQFTMPLSITQVQNFPRFPYNFCPTPSN
jgi:hypothetical protein